MAAAAMDVGLMEPDNTLLGGCCLKSEAQWGVDRLVTVWEAGVQSWRLGLMLGLLH